MQVEISTHAAERYQQRYEPSISVTMALHVLAELAKTARVLSEPRPRERGRYVVLDESRGVVGIVIDTRGERARRVMTTVVPRQEIGEPREDVDPWEECA